MTVTPDKTVSLPGLSAFLEAERALDARRAELIDSLQKAIGKTVTVEGIASAAMVKTIDRVDGHQRRTYIPVGRSSDGPRLITETGILIGVDRVTSFHRGEGITIEPIVDEQNDDGPLISGHAFPLKGLVSLEFVEPATVEADA